MPTKQRARIWLFPAVVGFFLLLGVFVVSNFNLKALPVVGPWVARHWPKSSATTPAESETPDDQPATPKNNLWEKEEYDPFADLTAPIESTTTSDNDFRSPGTRSSLPQEPPLDLSNDPAKDDFSTPVTSDPVTSDAGEGPALTLPTQSENTTSPALAKPKPSTATTSPDSSNLVRIEKLPPVTTKNGNGLIEKHRRDLTMDSSTVWDGWPARNAIDNDIETSFFSGKDDSADHGTQPWLEVKFPAQVEVGQVTILGNRDPNWLVGYTILKGQLELRDASGKVLRSQQSSGTGNFRDFDFAFEPPVAGVTSVRFISLQDQGRHTQYGDIGIAEIQVDGK